MEEKKIIKILGIAAIIQFVFLIAINFFSFSNVKDRSISKKLMNINKNDIVSFELSDKFDKFKIIKENNLWFVDIGSTKLPADKVKVEDYLKILGEITHGLVLYSGKDDASDKTYGFDNDNFQNLIVKTKNKEFNIVIGNPGTVRGTSLIKFQKENKIRQINSLISVKSSSIYKEWADRRIMPEAVKLDNISSFDVDFSNFLINERIIIKPDYDAKKKQTTFTMENFTGNLDELNVKALINGFINIKADNFKLSGTIQDKKLLGSIKIVTQLKEIGDISVDFYSADGDDIGNYIAKVNNSNFLYLFHENTLKDIIKSKTELIKK